MINTDRCAHRRMRAFDTSDPQPKCQSAFLPEEEQRVSGIFKIVWRLEYNGGAIPIQPPTKEQGTCECSESLRCGV